MNRLTPHGVADCILEHLRAPIWAVEPRALALTNRMFQASTMIDCGRLEIDDQDRKIGLDTYFQRTLFLPTPLAAFRFGAEVGNRSMLAMQLFGSREFNAVFATEVAESHGRVALPLFAVRGGKILYDGPGRAAAGFKVDRLMRPAASREIIGAFDDDEVRDIIMFASIVEALAVAALHQRGALEVEHRTAPAKTNERRIAKGKAFMQDSWVVSGRKQAAA